jgi:hypothetical protein
MPAERSRAEIRNFPAQIRTFDPPLRHRAEEAIGDITAVMEPGLVALMAVHARGVDARAAARSLWTQIDNARNAVLALAPHSGMGPKRGA